MKISDPTLGTLVCAFAATHSQCRSKNQVSGNRKSETTIQGQRFPSKKWDKMGLKRGEENNHVYFTIHSGPEFLLGSRAICMDAVV
jgi:hypothetical protein